MLFRSSYALARARLEALGADVEASHALAVTTDITTA